LWRLADDGAVAISSILWHCGVVVSRASSFDTEPVAAPADESRLIEVLRRALEERGAGASAARLLSMGGEPIEVPGSVLELLERVVHALAAGDAVAVLPVHAELTTQEAADLLNVSRPYLIGLLDDGALPFERTAGGHRRLRLADVLAYKHVRDDDRRAALDEMSSEAERLGLRF
jgi:excisionase family DNA binding protein